MFTLIYNKIIWDPNVVTHKQQEKHGCILNTVATDALVIKHQAISTHSTDWIFVVLDRFYTEISWL